MEIESLFSSTRWDILQALSKEGLAPMELAEQLNTTAANISQQLRLLELGGLVKSKRLSNVEKGKPRTVYTLAGSNAFMIIAMPGFADKKMVELDEYRRFMMATMFFDARTAEELGQVYFALGEHLNTIELIAASSSGSTLYMVADKKQHTSLQSTLKDAKVRLNLLDGVESLPADAIILLDPKGKMEVER